MRNRWILIYLLFVLLLSSCNSNEIATYQPQEDGTSQVTAIVEDGSSANEDTAEESSPPPTESPPTESTSTESPPQEIIHWEFPGSFAETPLQKIFDCQTGTYFRDGQIYELSEVCDQWERNYFERPLNEEMTELYPQLDILEAEFGQDENWYYTRIQVFSELVENFVLDGVYAIEIDLDLDARGDILIVATSPGFYPFDEWTSEGVQIWLDTNDDVGGPQAMLVDPRYDGDGYETLLVDSGIGDDPDLAFVKTYTETPGLIEFGFKASLLEDTESFEWWVWAMRENLGAAKYDPVDFFPQDTLFAMDNTCGWIFGSYSRDLPNICDSISTKSNENKPGPSCPPSTVKDTCVANGGVWEDYPECKCVIN